MDQEALGALEFLIQYLVAGGCEDELLETLLDYRYCSIRCDNWGIRALASDYDQAASSELRLTDEEREGLLLIKRALDLAATVVYDNASELPSQLVGRLARFENPVVEALVADVRLSVSGAWLEPRTSSLLPPMSSVVVLNRHAAPIVFARFTAGGTRLVTAGQDSQILLWDVGRGAMLSSYPTDGPVTAMAVASRSPVAIFATAMATSVVVWDTDFDGPRHHLSGHDAPLACAAISPSGRSAVTADAQGVVIVWDLVEGLPVLTSRLEDVGIAALAISDDGGRIAAAHLPSGMHAMMQSLLSSTAGADDRIDDDWNSSIRIYEIERSGLREVGCFGTDSIIAERPGSSGNIRLTDDGRSVSVLGQSSLLFFRTGVSEPIRKIELSLSFGASWDLGADEDFFLAVDQSASIVSGRVSAGQAPLERYPSRSSLPLKYTAVSADARLLAYGLADGSIVLERLSESREFSLDELLDERVRSMGPNPTYATPTAVSPTGEFLVWSEFRLAETGVPAIAGGGEWYLVVRDASTLVRVAELSLGNQRLHQARFSSDGTLLVTTDGSELRVWDAKSWEPVKVLRRGSAKFDAALAMPMASKSGGRNLHRSMTERLHLLEDVAISCDGRRIAAIAIGGMLTVWRTADGALLGSLPTGLFQTSSVAFYPGGKRLVVGGSDVESLARLADEPQTGSESRFGLAVSAMMRWSPGAIAIVDPQTGSRRRWSLKDDLKIFRLAVMPDGRTAVSVTMQGKLHRWSLETGEVLSTFHVCRFSQVECLAVSADGAIVATGATDGVVRLWDLEGETQIASFTTNGSVHGLAINADASLVVAADQLGWVHVLQGRGIEARGDHLSQRSVAELESLCLSLESPLSTSVAAARCLGRHGRAGAVALSRVLERCHQLAFSRAERVVRYATTSLKRLADPVAVQALSRAAHRNLGAYRAGYLLAALAVIPGCEAADAILRQLESPNPDIRLVALMALLTEDMHQRALAPEIAKNLLAESSSRVIGPAMKILSNQGESSIGLILPLLTGGSPAVSTAAVGALAALGSSRVLAPLKAQMALQSQPDERRKAATAIGKLGSHCKEDTSAEAELGLIGAFLSRLSAALGSDSALPTEHPVFRECAELLSAVAAEDPEPSVRIAAIHARVELGGRGAVVLLDTLSQHPDTRTREAVAEALGSIRGSQATTLLSRMLTRDASPQVRQRCVSGLASLDTVQSVHSIVEALEDEVPAVRHAAIRALAELDSAPVLMQIMKACGDEVMEVRLAAIGATRRVSRRLMTRIVSGTASKDDAHSVRSLFVQLSQIGDTAVLDVWANLLRDNSSAALMRPLLERLTAHKSADERAFIFRRVGLDPEPDL